MNHEEPLCKVFNINTPAQIDLMPPGPSQPLQKSYAGAFDTLVNELGAFRDAREAGEQRDRARRQDAQAASIARQQADAARNRRVLDVQRQKYQQHQKRRVLAKAATPAPAPDFDRIARQQAQIETALRESAARATQNAVRDRLAGLAQDAKNGRLDVHSAAMFDVLRGRAGAMGLTP